MELKSKFPGLASLGNSLEVESAIIRSKHVMEECKALTSTNSSSKNRSNPSNRSFDLNLSLSNSKIDDKKDSKPAFKPLYPSEPDPMILCQEIQSLNMKLSAQSAYIKTLEGKIGELKVENEKLMQKNARNRIEFKQEVQDLKQLYEDKIKEMNEKNVLGLEGRMELLEEKIKIQSSQFENIEGRVGGIEKKAKLLVKGSFAGSEEEREEFKGNRTLDRDKIRKIVGGVLRGEKEREKEKEKEKEKGRRVLDNVRNGTGADGSRRKSKRIAGSKGHVKSKRRN